MRWSQRRAALVLYGVCAVFGFAALIFPATGSKLTGFMLFVISVAVIIAVGVMLFASGPLARFVHDHPTVKMLALSVLLLIGVTLIADGLGFHIPKEYIYAAMAFSVFVEALNLRARQKRVPVELRPTFVKDQADESSART